MISKNRVMQIACATMLATAAMAQTTIVENSDAVGRHPYRSSGEVQNTSSYVGIVDFAPVPSNKRLVLEHISARILAPADAMIACRITNSTYPVVIHWLTPVPAPVTISASPGGGDLQNILMRQYTISQPISMVLDSFETPRLACQTYSEGKMKRIDMQAGASGRLMDGFR